MNKIASKVSILIPAYNCESTIAETLQSAFNQTYSNIEIIILNDCSTDGSYELMNELIKGHPNVILKSNNSNQGYLKTFNLLLNMATGDYITFLDSDDLISHDKIEKQVEFLLNNKDYGCCGTGFTRTNGKGNSYEDVVFPMDDCEIKRHLKLNIEVCFCGSSVMITRDVFENIGGYREYFIGCPAEDYDWIRRISNRYKCYNIPECLYYYRFGVNSLTRNISYDTKAQYAAEIAFYLDEQRCTNSGEDALTNIVLKHDLDLLISDYKRILFQKPEIILCKRAINEAVNGNWKASIRLVYQVFQVKKLAGIKISFVTFILIVLPVDWLLYLKAKFNFKKILRLN